MHGALYAKCIVNVGGLGDASPSPVNPHLSIDKSLHEGSSMPTARLWILGGITVIVEDEARATVEEREREKLESIFRV